MSVALESQSGPEKNQIPKTPSTPNVAQDLTPLSKGKQALQNSKNGYDSIDQNKQSSTSWPIGSFQDGLGILPSSDEERIIALGPSSSSKKRLIQALQETDFWTDGPDSTHSNLEGVATTGALVGATVVEPNVGSVVAVLGEASLEPNGGDLVVLNDVGRVEPFDRPIVILHGVALAQSNVALLVAPPGEVLAQPNIAPNVAPPAPAIVAPRGVAPVQPDVAPPAPAVVVPRGVAPVQPDVAPHAQRNGAAPAPAQLNVALIVAPPAVVVLDVNYGLNRSQLKPLRICEIGSEGHFCPKLPQI